MIDRFDDVLRVARENDLESLCAELAGQSDIDPKTADQAELFGT